MPREWCAATSKATRRIVTPNSCPNVIGDTFNLKI